MSLNTLRRIIDNCYWNVLTIAHTCMQPRDMSIWLFGSWMGERFADNSRFWFQYLSENKDKYGISEVVWVSNNNKVVDEVKSLGYKAYVINSKESDYYHYKAGVHVICNSNTKDIDTKKSIGAIKIQLWHGNGIKASGKLTRKANVSFKERVWDYWIKPLIIPGRWYYAYWLACSEESKRVLTSDSGALSQKVIIANSPRLCPCLSYTQSEIDMIGKINAFKKQGKKVILYLPTFRAKGTKYTAPVEIPGFIDYLKSDNLIWVQKNHSADNKDSISSNSCENILTLDSSFDVNVLYDHIDILVSDYSSATTDAIYKNVVTINYCPDYDEFYMNDRGFVKDYESYHVGEIVKNPIRLIEVIDYCLDKSVEDFDDFLKVRNFLFDNNIADYEIITRTVLNTIY